MPMVCFPASHVTKATWKLIFVCKHWDAVHQLEDAISTHARNEAVTGLTGCNTMMDQSFWAPATKI